MAYEEQNYEESIDLMALLAAMLRRWQVLLAAVVVGALLLGGYQALKPASPKVDEAKIKEVQTALDTNKTTLAANETELAGNETTTQSDTEKIATNEEALVTYRASQATLEGNLAALQAGLERAQAVLADPDATAEETAAVIVQLPTLTNDIADANNQVSAAAKQVKTASDEITAWQAEISTLAARTETLTEANQKLQAQIKQQEEQLATLQAGEPGGKSVTTYVILGALLGALVYCGVVFLRYVFNHKLRTATELQERCRLPILGEFYSQKAQGHKGFNRKLDKLAGDGQTLPESEKVFELIAAGVVAGASSPVRLAVTGTVPEKTLAAVAEKLGALLPEGYAVCAQANPVYNAAFLAQLKEYTVLLVEAKGVSQKDEIARLSALLRRSQVNILGAVVQ